MLLITNDLDPLTDGVYINEGVVDEETLEAIITKCSDAILVRANQWTKYLPPTLYDALRNCDKAKFVCDYKITEIIKQHQDEPLNLFVFFQADTDYKIFKYRKRT